MLAAVAALAPFPVALAEPLPTGFVLLRDVDPSIRQDIRYATADNFTGRPVPGYGAAECILHEVAARALARVQADLAQIGLSLQVYDCYRPQRAVRAFLAWAGSGEAGETSSRFHPRVPRSSLVSLGYISAGSDHSKGTAVDVTLVPLAAGQPAAPHHSRSAGPCTVAGSHVLPDAGLDMGTTFDCFDRKSHAASHEVNAAQRRARHLLVSAMARRGFVNYPREWWHFAIAVPGAAASHDVPIPPRPSGAR